MSAQLPAPVPATGNAKSTPPGAGRVRLARLIAAAADVLELAIFPAFLGGVLSPWNDALDIVVGALMVRLLGWHFAFLPTFVAEMIPGVGLIPTWTAAVWLVTRTRR